VRLFHSTLRPLALQYIYPWSGQVAPYLNLHSHTQKVKEVGTGTNLQDPPTLLPPQSPQPHAVRIHIWEQNKGQMPLKPLAFNFSIAFIIRLHSTWQCSGSGSVIIKDPEPYFFLSKIARNIRKMFNVDINVKNKRFSTVPSLKYFFSDHKNGAVRSGSGSDRACS
jgi:hypothetical protein